MFCILFSFKFWASVTSKNVGGKHHQLFKHCVQSNFRIQQPKIHTNVINFFTLCLISEILAIVNFQYLPPNVGVWFALKIFKEICKLKLSLRSPSLGLKHRGSTLGCGRPPRF